MSAHLLDTCALLWWMADAPELGQRARRAIANQRNEIIVSAASLWESAVKRRRGRLAGVDEYLARYAALHAEWGFSTVVIEPADVVAAGNLVWKHEDPFDRMIVVQARRLDARIVTCDETMTAFVADCLW